MSAAEILAFTEGQAACAVCFSENKSKEEECTVCAKREDHIAK